MAIIESQTFPLKLFPGETRSCLGPDRRLDPPQPVYQRTGFYTLQDGTRRLSNGKHPEISREITIVACPQLEEGNICKRVGIPCIMPFVISSPQTLATQPDSTTLTFRPISTLELFSDKP